MPIHTTKVHSAIVRGKLDVQRQRLLRVDGGGNFFGVLAGIIAGKPDWNVELRGVAEKIQPVAPCHAQRFQSGVRAGVRDGK